MFRDHSLTTNSHRALIAVGSLAALALAFALFLGWYHYFNERARRERLIKMAEATTQRASLVAAQRSADSESMLSASGTSAKAASLQEIGRDEVQVDPLAMVRIADPATPAQVESATKALQRFWQASHWTDKVPCVHNPGRVRLLLQVYYETQKNKDPVFGDFLRSDRYRLGGHELLVMSYANAQKDGEASLVMVAEPDGTFSLDWESYVGWGDMSFVDLKQVRPTSAKLMRVNARVDDNYRGEFSDPASFVGFELMSPDGLNTLHGFVDKQGALTQSLLRATAGGGFNKLALLVQYPPDAKGNESVRITGLVADRWFVLR